MNNPILILNLVRLRSVKKHPYITSIRVEGGLHKRCLVSHGCDSRVSMLMQRLHLNQWL